MRRIADFEQRRVGSAERRGVKQLVHVEIGLGGGTPTEGNRLIGTGSGTAGSSGALPGTTNVVGADSDVLPATSVTVAPIGICSWSVPVAVGVTATLKTDGQVFALAASSDGRRLAVVLNRVVPVGICRSR